MGAALCLAGLGLSGAPIAAAGAHFGSAGEVTALRGVHEVVLTSAQPEANPFATEVTVTFVRPSGAARAVTVDAFHDGGAVWRARAYADEVGAWLWTSRCASDASLDGQSGSFTVRHSALRGMLRPHRANSRAWMTDDGQWFPNLSDTAYRLFHVDAAPDWQRYVADDVAKGITSLRCASLGGWGGTPAAKVDSNDYWLWNDPWPGGAKPDHSRLDLRKFQATDQRLRWLLETYPDVQVQLILFGLKGYGGDGTGQWWAALPPAVRVAAMRTMLARWAAFPNVFWLLVNDMACDAKHPLNMAFAREAGRYIAAHDPWRHLLSVGPVRRAGFAFTSAEDREWCGYVHLEDAYSLGAQTIAQRGLADDPRHVFLGEDYYEQDHGFFADPRFFYRWLYWSWLLSGGSANYGGRYGTTHPYSQTDRPDLVWVGADGTYTGIALTGLDSVPFIKSYFEDRRIDFGLFTPADAIVADVDGAADKRRPKAMRRDDLEFLVYHPNAAADGRDAKVSERTARLRLDLSQASGTYATEWFRALDGAAAAGGPVAGGSVHVLAAPWAGQDVVLRLLRQPAR